MQLKHLGIFLWMVVLAFPLAGCRGIDPVEATDDSGNLLSNGSFERDGEPTLVGWLVNEDELTELIEEAPPEGGAFCLKLDADWAPTRGYVTALVPEARDGDVLRLSATVRAVGEAGEAVIGIVTGMNPAARDEGHRTLMNSTETDWTRITLTHTVSLSEGESVWVLLSSADTEVAQRTALFDLVTLERAE